MRADDVLTVLDLVRVGGGAGVLAGGWAVDALVGEERRVHADVDIVLDDFETSLPPVRAAMASLGFREVEQRDIPGLWMPRFCLLDDGAGHRIELVSIDWDLLCRAIDADQATVRQRAITSGTIRGHTVACLSGPVQLLFHAGYPPRLTDVADVAALLRLLITPPSPFSGDCGRARRAAMSVEAVNRRRAEELLTATRHKRAPGTSLDAMRDLQGSLPPWLGEAAE